MTFMLKELLVRRKSAILDKWINRILGYYPPESFKFLASQKDRFANPIGYTVSVSAGAVLDELVGDGDPLITEALLKDVVKMKAVQEFSPSQALRFVFDLKDVIRHEINEQTVEPVDIGELAEYESKIDGWALVAFDSYMEARERLFRIRLNEVKARSLQAMTMNEGLRSNGNGNGTAM